MPQSKSSMDLQKRLKALYEKRDAALQIMNQIKELLAKADERRASESGDPRRWNSVLNHLETSLDDARKRLDRCEAVIRQVETQAGISPSTGETFTSTEEGGAEGGVPFIELDPDKAVEQVLAMSLSDLSQLTMEQVAMLHARLPEKEPSLDGEQMQQAAARLELANQTRGTVTGTPPQRSRYMERRNQLLLRATLEKVRQNRLADVTHEEKLLLTNCLELLCRRLEPDPREERIKAMLREAVDRLGLKVSAG